MRSTDETSDPRAPVDARRVTAWGACAALILAVAVIFVVLAVDRGSRTEGTVLVGAADTAQIVVSAFISACLAAAILSSAVRGRNHRELAILVAARVTSVGALLLTLPLLVLATLDSPTVTPIIDDGCETGYVAREQDMHLGVSSTIYRQVGLRAEAVGSVRSDGGFRPFADGAYRLARTSEGWRVSTAPTDGAAIRPLVREDILLTARADFQGRCGIAVAAYDPTPTPIAPAPEPPALDDARAALSTMVEVSLDAAVGPLASPDGARPTSTTTSSSCGYGAVTEMTIVEMTTGDNASSVERILEAWDAAGYRSARAIQVVLRYNSLITLELRDTTTSDGYLRMTVSTAWLPVDS